MAKSYAVRSRGADKDYYDIVHVLLYNRAGGPEQAGRLLAGGKFAEDVKAARSIFREIEARFTHASAFGPQSYVQQALRVQPEADAAQLAQDAVAPSPSSPPHSNTANPEPHAHRRPPTCVRRIMGRTRRRNLGRRSDSPR